jgi:hypothetical protein
LIDLARRFDASEQELDLLLREVASKMELNIVSQCEYLKPELE